MKVALIGAGAWGKHLAENLYEMGALYAVAEPNSALAAAVRARCPGLPVVDDYRLLLDTPVRAFAIATPVPTHFAIAKEALHAGKDVFVEKPITLTSAEADQLSAIAAARDRVLMVGHLLLYQPAVCWIKEYLDSGALGTIVSLHQERLNLGRARAVENALWSFGVHDLAVLLHLVGGAPSTVSAVGTSSVTPGVADDVHVHLGWDTGVSAHLHASWLWPEKRRRLTIVGTAGMLVYDELEQCVVVHAKGIGPDLVAFDAGVSIGYTGHAEPLRLELAHFVARLGDRRRPTSDGPSGAAVVRVMEAAEASMKEVSYGLLRA